MRTSIRQRTVILFSIILLPVLLFSSILFLFFGAHGNHREDLCVESGVQVYELIGTALGGAGNEITGLDTTLPTEVISVIDMGVKKE